ncbi:MAG: NAD(P)-dependent oxidoreductase [Rhizobiaceae bacterium]|nr:NAD(P)-dependent oxidoreductase [Rhizobiaceae bacterium]
MSKPSIGFIGLGLMGSAIVNRMIKQGYSLNVIANRSRTNVDIAVAAGATEYKTSRELTAASDIVMFCMDTSDSVESRVYGENGVLAGAKSGQLIIDTGTSLPGSTKKISADLAIKGARYMDSPLGRTPSHAVDGLLNIMTAGDKADFDEILPVLQDIGENIFHVGPLGAGHTLKLINNFYAMTTACAMSEAFAMADLAGLPRETLHQVMSAGPLKSGMMDFIKAYAVDGDANSLAFTIANARKDVGYYSLMADDFGVPSQMSAGTKNTLGLAKATGWADKMVPEMVNFFENLFGSKK